ncbi:MAG: hypothetical protein ACRYGP_11515 [Janthinobacterium lividum]
MDYILTNLGSILVATVAGLVLSLVYHRTARQPGDLRRSGSPGLLVTAGIAEFWLACILAGALILAPQQAGAWTMAIGSAVVIWIGFVLPVLAVTETARGVPVARTVADNLHWLVVMVAQAVVLHLVGLTAPHV